jgi:acetyl-CoA acetyltransferase
VHETAIAGLGITEMGKVYGKTSADFAAEAVGLAVRDAGLALTDLDGLLINAGVSGGLGIDLAARLGLYDLALLSAVNAYGSTASAMVQLASFAIAAGHATTIACVFGDAPLRETTRTGEMYSGGSGPRRGLRGLSGVAGLSGAPSTYALAARRHMHAYGTNEDHFAAVAVSQRDWARDNAHAQMRDPITVDDHHASRWVAEPLRLLDCCLVSNGGIAVVVTSAERARDLRQPPVYVWGWGQSHPGYTMERGCEWGLRTGAVESGRAAYARAGIGPRDIDVASLYDCFTYTVIVSLEDYGFCEKGEGGPFAASGALGRGGSLPTNTGGGQLSSFYMWGMTPLSEGVVQVRGQGGGRQAPKHDLVLVSGNGGTVEHHGTLVLGAHPRHADAGPTGGA